MRYLIGYGRSRRFSFANLITSRLNFHSESMDRTSKSRREPDLPKRTALTANEDFGVIDPAGVEGVNDAFPLNAN